MSRAFPLFLSMLMCASITSAQPHAAPSYRPHIAHPAYLRGGPSVAVDEEHNNFHTLAGSFAPFGELLSADGYEVRAFTERFTAHSLRGVNILVIANARGAGLGLTAFTDDELVAIRDWVNQGGSLFLISDHAPFGIAALGLGEMFGVNMGSGFVLAHRNGRLSSHVLFVGSRLGQHAIVEGRNASERIRSVESFTGQSLSIPPGGIALLALPPDAVEVGSAAEAHQLTQSRNVPALSVADRAQAIALPFGKGRVVVAGEAAMFTEQVVRGVGPVGLRDHDNEQFTLNVMHWLSHLIG